MYGNNKEERVKEKKIPYQNFRCKANTDVIILRPYKMFYKSKSQILGSLTWHPAHPPRSALGVLILKVMKARGRGDCIGRSDQQSRIQNKAMKKIKRDER